MRSERQRLAAYGLCRQNGQILLARVASPDGAQRYWTLPGGGVEHAEDPFEAVGREVEEETGYRVQVERLLGVDSRTHRVDRAGSAGGELHHVGIFYLVRVVDGDLRHETSGSTDRAAWFPEAEVPELPRAVVVDVALNLERVKPPDGHVPPVPLVGPLRN